MNEAILQKVNEVVKTLNLNIDSETGKTALLETIKELIPLIRWYVIVEKVFFIVRAVMIIGGIYLCLKTVYRIVDRMYVKKD